MKATDIGRIGEKIAAKYLRKKHYKIIETNKHQSHNEIDLIVSNKNYIVFVEVKTRSNDVYGEPKDAVGYRKQEKYKKIAQYYKLKYGETPVSFAVVEVTEEKINLIEDAF